MTIASSNYTVNTAAPKTVMDGIRTGLNRIPGVSISAIMEYPKGSDFDSMISAELSKYNQNLAP